MSVMGKDINQLAHRIKNNIKETTNEDLIIVGEFLTLNGFVRKGVGIDSEWEFDNESRHSIFTGKYEYLKKLFRLPEHFIVWRDDCE